MSRLEQLKNISNNEKLYWQIASDAEVYGISFGAAWRREISAAEEAEAAAAAALPPAGGDGSC